MRLHRERLPLQTSDSTTDDALRREIASAEQGAALLSIVHGMAFALIALPSLEHSSAVRLGVAPELLVELLLEDGCRGGWSTRRYYYVVLDCGDRATYRLRTRMVKSTPAMERLGDWKRGVCYW